MSLCCSICLTDGIGSRRLGRRLGEVPGRHCGAPGQPSLCSAAKRSHRAPARRRLEPQASKAAEWPRLRCRVWSCAVSLHGGRPLHARPCRAGVALAWRWRAAGMAARVALLRPPVLRPGADHLRYEGHVHALPQPGGRRLWEAGDEEGRQHLPPRRHRPRVRPTRPHERPRDHMRGHATT